MKCDICKRDMDKPVVTYHAHDICEACDQRIQEYAIRVQSRLTRLRNRADSTEAEAQREIDRASQMASVIPFGQPILVGHHSERRDRRYRDRIHSGYQRGFEAMKRAERQRERAEAAEKNRVISSDDPAAVVKMQAKIDEAVKRQEFMKLVNRHVRSLRNKDWSDLQRADALLQKVEGLSARNAYAFFQPDFVGRYGFPSYALTNNNANIRRMRQRLETLKAQAQRLAQADEEDEVVAEADTDLEGVTVERDFEDNRIRIKFPGKPDAAVRDILKKRGFRWSRLNMAWQRQLNNSGEWAVEMALKEIAPLWGNE